MFYVQGATEVADGHAAVDFRRSGGWPAQFGSMTMAAIAIGDEERGPSIALSHLRPGAKSDGAPAHAHASDNFRISLLGHLQMGREDYGPGQFRFQEGWKAYPNDNSSHGPDGGWEILVMGDKRGTRARFVREELPNLEQTHALIVSTLRLGGDLISDDPADGSGPSALATSLADKTKGGKLNGAFVDCVSWPSLSPTTRAAITLMGDPICGPVLILAATEPGAVAAPGVRFDTEVFRAVINGSCEIDGREYRVGEMRVERAGEWSGPVVAGPDGLHEMVVVGDRRFAQESFEQWSPALGEIVRDLGRVLADREPVAAG